MVGDRQAADVAVIGAGSSGLAVMKALGDEGIELECFERGSDVGGLWRYENDNGLSGAYASLRTNVSRMRMQYPSFPMPLSFDDFPHHSEMAAYLGAFADAYGLRTRIRFGTTVERLEPDLDGRWKIVLDDGVSRIYRAVVVAIGPFWCPRLPTYPGSFGGTVSHSHGYRTPDRFADRRVLVVGAGQSAAEIAVDVSAVAERTLLSLRGGVHVIPRWIGRNTYDAADVAPLNRLPWRLLNLIYRARVARGLGPLPASLPRPAHRLLEGIPIVSSELVPAVRRGDVVVKPAIARLFGQGACFVDGSAEPVDDIVYATGYRISVPFLSSSLLSANGREFPLYRRIVPPALAGLYFAGFVDAPGALPCSVGGCVSRRPCRGGARSSEPSGARGSVSRARVPRASAATRTPTFGSCGRISCGRACQQGVQRRMKWRLRRSHSRCVRCKSADRPRGSRPSNTTRSP
jgi:Flavin-binding monooxygenase-like